VQRLHAHAETKARHAVEPHAAQEPEEGGSLDRWDAGVESLQIAGASLADIAR
jgi:hypothetical protein